MRRKNVMIWAMVLILCVTGGWIARKAVLHERRQSREIHQLQGVTGYLTAKLQQATDYYQFKTEYSDDSFNYLAIGNSLTLVTTWGRGICSTRPDNDYFNLVVKDLQRVHGKVVAYPYNFAPWERSGDRSSTLDLLDVYLSDRLNLVTIQLGENVTDISTYEQDLEQLVAYIRQKAPRASVVIIGDFWNAEKTEMRKVAAEHTNCPFADLSAIAGKKEFQSKAGTECLLEDGSTIVVSKEAETHPGDAGMEAIAAEVLRVLP